MLGGLFRSMKAVVSALIALGLLTAGVEGAIDAVHVAHDGEASGLHEEHHEHPGSPGDPHDPGDPDSDGHTHTCHCGLHVPPLFTTETEFASHQQHVRGLTEPALHALALGPPPLPPPIA